LKILLLAMITQLADIEAALGAARALPGQGWENRLSSSQPLGSGETFFMHLRAALYLRVGDPDSLYDLQCELYPAPDNVVAAARDFGSALATLASAFDAIDQLACQTS
jgi:ATP-dependent DNA helicase DinG